MSNPVDGFPQGAEYPMVRMPSAGRDWLLFPEFPVHGDYPFSEVTVDDTRYVHHARNMFLPADASPGETSALYNYWAPQYDEQNPWTPQYGLDIIDFTGLPAGPVLDLGTGTGMVLEGLVQAGVDPRQITGVDNSAAMLGVARQKEQNGTLQGARLVQFNLATQDLTDLYDRPASVDLVTASYSLHDVPRYKWDRVLHGIARLLSVSGHFVVVNSLVRRGAVEFRNHVEEFFGEDERYEVVGNNQVGQFDANNNVAFTVGYQIVRRVALL